MTAAYEADHELQRQNRLTHIKTKAVCGGNLDQCVECGAAEQEMYDNSCTKFKALHPDREK